MQTQNQTPKKSITLAIKELDEELTTFLQARLEINDNDQANELIDKYIALISIAANLSAERKHSNISDTVVEDIADLLT